jgi:hypothetical protein
MKTILDIWVEDHGVQVESFTNVLDKDKEVITCEFSDTDFPLDDTVLIKHKGISLKTLFPFLNVKTTSLANLEVIRWQFAKEYVCITPEELKAKIHLGLVTPDSYYFKY